VDTTKAVATPTAADTTKGQQQQQQEAGGSTASGMPVLVMPER
jgi:hypothetical protein